MRIMIVHNVHCRLATVCIINYDLDYILTPNISKLLHTFLQNVEPTLRKSPTFTEDKNTSLSLTAMKLIIDLFCASNHPSHQIKIPFDLQVIFMGSNILYTTSVRFYLSFFDWTLELKVYRKLKFEWKK